MGYIRKALETGYLVHPGLHAVLTTCLRFSSVLDGDVSGWLACTSSAGHQDHLQKPVLIRDDKIKWLDFGMTPDPQNLQPHPGFVWVKSGYSEAIAWRKVQLTKQRNVDLTTDGNVDLTTDGLWAMGSTQGGCL